MVEDIKAVYRNDDTARTLGEKLGISRNSVIGYYSRNPQLRLTHPLAGRLPSPNAGAVRREAAKGVDHVARAARIKVRREALKQAAAAQLPPPATGKYTLIDLPANCCKWPVGDVPATMMFCGEIRIDDKPYCAYHAHRSVYNEAQADK